MMNFVLIVYSVKSRAARGASVRFSNITYEIRQTYDRHPQRTMQHKHRILVSLDLSMLFDMHVFALCNESCKSINEVHFYNIDYEIRSKSVCLVKLYMKFIRNELYDH